MNNFSSLLSIPFSPPTTLIVADFLPTKDENIGNHGYIGISILRIYRIYRRYILEKNIGA